MGFKTIGGAHCNAPNAIQQRYASPIGRIAMRPYMIFLLFLLAVPLQAQTKAPTPQVKRQPIGAAAYIVMDVETGRVLAQRNAYQKMFPASTTKVMTALVAIEKGDLNKVVRIGPNPPKTGEASILLLEGEHFRLADLVRAALIRSGNDACIAIAEAVAGDVPSFVKMMNQTAQEIGAKQTHFVNPHGLHDPQHFTTAHDLAIITRRAMTYPFFNQVVATKSTTIKGNYKIGERRVLHNRNRLLFRWDKADGVKTGYTRQAGRCLIASATVKNPANGQPWRLLSVVLKSPDTWNDSYNLLKFHGFDQYQPTVVTRADKVAAQADVVGGAQPVAAVVKHDVQLPLRSFEKANIEFRPHLDRVLAPVSKGQRVGYLEYWFKGRRLGAVPLVAAEDVRASLVARELPAAAPLVPVEPWKRYGLYVLVAAFLVTLLVTILTFLKAIYNVRRKKNRPATFTSYETRRRPQGAEYQKQEGDRRETAQR